VAGTSECSMKLQVPQNAGIFLTCRGPVSFSGRILPRGVSIAPYSYARFKAFVTVSMSNSVFKHVMPCTLIGIYQRLQPSD